MLKHGQGPTRAAADPPVHVPLLSGGAKTFRLPGRFALAVLLYGGSLLLLNLGSTRALTYHEVLFAQPAKEMVASGNWVLPMHGGVPSTHKPPGAHWAIAVMMALTGSEAEGVVRIPAVLAALVCALLVAAMAARWFGSRIGLLAGLVQLTMYYVLQLSRLAECDMLLVAAVCGAMYCFALANVDSPRGRVQARWIPWLFYFCVGLSYLFKGLIGPVFVFSGCVLFLLVNQDLRGLKFFFSPVGLAVFLACTAGWFAAAYAQYPKILEDQVFHHFGRFRGELGGDKPMLYYAWSILLNTLPWSPLALGAAAWGIRRGLYAEPFWRFAACWILPGLVVLCVSTFKSKHYAAPLMPPLTILSALALVGFLRARIRATPRSHLVTVAATVAGCSAGAVAVWRGQPRGVEIILLLIGVLAAGLLLTIYFEFRRRMNATLVTIFALCWLIITGVLSGVMPHHDSYRDQAELARRVNRAVPPGQSVYLVRLEENQITYYLQPPVRRFDRPEEFSESLDDLSGELYVLAPEFLADAFRQHRHVQVLDRCASLNRYPTERERLTLLRLGSAARLGQAPAADGTGERRQ